MARKVIGANGRCRPPKSSLDETLHCPKAVQELVSNPDVKGTKNQKSKGRHAPKGESGKSNINSKTKCKGKNIKGQQPESWQKGEPRDPKNRSGKEQIRNEPTPKSGADNAQPATTPKAGSRLHPPYLPREPDKTFPEQPQSPDKEPEHGQRQQQQPRKEKPELSYGANLFEPQADLYQRTDHFLPTHPDIRAQAMYLLNNDKPTLEASLRKWIHELHKQAPVPDRLSTKRLNHLVYSQRGLKLREFIELANATDFSAAIHHLTGLRLGTTERVGKHSRWPSKGKGEGDENDQVDKSQPFAMKGKGKKGKPSQGLKTKGKGKRRPGKSAKHYQRKGKSLTEKSDIPREVTHNCKHHVTPGKQPGPIGDSQASPDIECRQTHRGPTPTITERIKRVYKPILYRAQNPALAR